MAEERRDRVGDVTAGETGGMEEPEGLEGI